MKPSDKIGRVDARALDRAIESLKKNAVKPFTVMTEEEAVEMTQNDHVGHKWSVGDQYYLCQMGGGIVWVKR